MTLAATIQRRIQDAYLSEKNISSVHELLLHELHLKQIPDLYAHAPRVLADFVARMMLHVFKESEARLNNDENLTVHPKRTVVLLNYIALRKCYSEVVKQAERIRPLSKRPPARPTASRVPPNLIYTNSSGNKQSPSISPSFPRSLAADARPLIRSVPIDSLYPPKKKKQAISIKALSKGDWEIDDWWTQHARKVPANVDKQANKHDRAIEKIAVDVVPNFSITLHSHNRSIKEDPFPSTYTSSVSLPSHVENLHLTCIRVNLAGNVVAHDANRLYYAEDNESMQCLVVPNWHDEKTSGFSGENSLQIFLDILAKTMTEKSKRYRYEIHLNRQTDRIAIVQHERATDGHDRNLQLFFEQTQGNCHSLFGFKAINYNGATRYEAPFVHGFRWKDKNIHLRLQFGEPAPGKESGENRERSEEVSFEATCEICERGGVHAVGSYQSCFSFTATPGISTFEPSPAELPIPLGQGFITVSFRDDQGKPIDEMLDNSVTLGWLPAEKLDIVALHPDAAIDPADTSGKASSTDDALKTEKKQNDLNKCLLDPIKVSPDTFSKPLVSPAGKVVGIAPAAKASEVATCLPKKKKLAALDL